MNSLVAAVRSTATVARPSAVSAVAAAASISVRSVTGGAFTTADTPGAVAFDIAACDTHKSEAPPTVAYSTAEEMLEYYQEMVTVRRMEEECDKQYKSKHIRGFCHLYIGQEAVGTGIEAAITKNDHQITAYRCHGNMIARGASVEGVISELMGRHSGSSRGKGGSMHMYHDNFYGGNGIVGAQVPLGAGIALGIKNAGKDEVAIAMYGDGAANQGQVFEAFNMAKLWDLPCIFIIENNKFAMGTAVDRASANTQFYTRGDYVPGLRVDGMDVLAVRTAVDFARQFCLAGNGPMLLEMNTYRYRGHSMSDPGTSYRTRDDVNKVRKEEDALLNTRTRIVDNGFATDAELKKMEKSIKKEVEAASQRAIAAAEPPVEELHQHVYLPGTTHLVRGIELNQSVTTSQ